MSARYPNGLNAALFPHRLEIVTAVTRDAYAKIVSEQTVSAAGRVDIRTVELMESGTRSMRDGARIVIAAKPSFEMAMGLIVKHKGKRYSVVSYSTTPSHTGEVYVYECVAVVKASDK